MPHRSEEMSALALLASDELHELQKAEAEGRGSRSHPYSEDSHMGASAYGAHPSVASFATAQSGYVGGGAGASSPLGSSTERPPGCAHEDCHRSYNQRIAAALGPLHHQASGGAIASHTILPPPPPPSAAGPYTYGYGARPPVQVYGPHIARNLASNPSSMPSSREHSPRFSPHDSNMSEDYGSDGEHHGLVSLDDPRRSKCGPPAPLMLPQPRLPGPGPSPTGAHAAAYGQPGLLEWTPSSSPVLGPLKSMSLFSHTVPNSPYASRPGSPVRGHRLSPPNLRGSIAGTGSISTTSTSPIQHHMQHPAGAVHVAGHGHHPAHRHRSHPYGGPAISESRSHHHLSSLGHATEQSPTEAAVHVRPSVSRNNSSAFGNAAKSSSSLSLSAYHLTGPGATPDPRRLVKEGNRTASDSVAGARSAGASRTHLPSLTSETFIGNRDSSRQLPSIFGHHIPLHSVANEHHHSKPTHSFLPYGYASHGHSGHGQNHGTDAPGSDSNCRETKRSTSRSAPASRATSPSFNSPRLHGSRMATASHSRQSSAHHLPSPPQGHGSQGSIGSMSPPTSFLRAGHSSVQHSPSATQAQPNSRQVSPSSAVLLPLIRSGSSMGGNCSGTIGSNGAPKHGSSKNIFAMTPIHMAGTHSSSSSVSAATTLPPISSLDAPRLAGLPDPDGRHQSMETGA